MNPDGNGFYVCAACGRAFRRTDSGENGGSAAVRRTESTENAVSGNAVTRCLQSMSSATQARESMTTPVSKTKSTRKSCAFCMLSEK